MAAHEPAIPNPTTPRLDGAIPGEPTLEEVKQWLRLPSADTLDDIAMQASLAAAIEWQRRHLHFPTDPSGSTYYPPDLHLAVRFRVARYLARRNSPDGLVGFSDFGPARVARFDADIHSLEATYKPTVFA